MASFTVSIRMYQTDRYLSKTPVIAGGRTCLSTPARLMEDHQYTHIGRSSILSRQMTRRVQSIKWPGGWRPR